jgi:hypothetical protein
MSTVKGLRAASTALVLTGMMLAAATVNADERVTTEQPSSVLIFPKVVNTSGDANTIIQITNTTNLLVDVHCFYVNGQSVGGVPIWQVTDFDLALTRQQPTHWSVRDGRPVNPMDSSLSGKGLDPGLIPPVPTGFTGFLTCVEVMPSGEPSGANSLKGEATVGQVTTLGGPNGVSKYNGIGIQACDPDKCCDNSGATGCGVNDDSVLMLDDKEYAACPGGLFVNFEAEGGSDLAIDGSGNTPSAVSTNLSLVPCGMDFENLIPGSTLLTLTFHNEFENVGSVTRVPVQCWFGKDLSDPLFGGQLDVGNLGSDFGNALLTPFGPTDIPALGVANVLRTAGDGSSDTAATNLHFCTDASAPDNCAKIHSEIRLPSLQ